MLSTRYGDLREVAAHTDGDCHLCLQPLDLLLYGRTGYFGADTVTVDHLEPQCFGGGDHLENLRLAHGTCNSRRGTRDASLVRMELTGVEAAPMSSTEKTVWSVGGGAAVGLGVGYAFARQLPDGSRQFNCEAAVLSAVLAGAFIRLAL